MRIFFFWHWKIHWQVLLAIFLGVFAGWINSKYSSPSAWDLELYQLFGTLFMNALKMLVVPLVMTSIISAMGNLSSQSGFAKMGIKTLLFYASTSFIAILIGLLLVNTISPGTSSGLSAKEAALAVSKSDSQESKKMAFLQKRTDGKDSSSMLNVFKELIPKNIYYAMSHQKMLGLIVFSLLFGYFITSLEEQHRQSLRVLFDGLYQVMIKITFFVLKFLPYGVFCLIAQTSSETFSEGNVLERLTQLSKFAITVLLSLGCHAFIVLPLYLILVAKVKPSFHFKAVAQALLTAFSTASSSSTLPITMKSVEERAKVSKRVTSFVLPVGATVNMDGTALYECIAVLFLAQLSGIQLDASTQFTVVLLALLTSIGVAGIPSASLVAIMIILKAVNDQLPNGQHIPTEALAVILIFDRLLDMCRTAVNVLGDTVGSVVIAKSEGEQEVLSRDPNLLSS